MTRWHLLIPLTTVLGGCGVIGDTHGTFSNAAPANKFAPDDAQRNLAAAEIEAKPLAAIAAAPAPPPDRAAELARLPANSKEWWALHDAIEAEADARMSKSLIICNGCFARDADDRTGSIK